MKLYYKIIDDKPVYSYCKTIVLEQSHNGIKSYHTILHPTEEQILAAGWEEYIAPLEEQLRIAKQEKIEQLEQYDASANVNEFTINGSAMWLDHNVRQQLKTSVEAYATAGAETVTKIFNETEYTFTPEQWLQMLVLLEIYASDALNNTERHKIAINALTTLEEVEDYDYTTGYPTKLQF